MLIFQSWNDEHNKSSANNSIKALMFLPVQRLVKYKYPIEKLPESELKQEALTMFQQVGGEIVFMM